MNWYLKIIICCSYDTSNKSTKGASKQRRDSINHEINKLRDLLPIPASARSVASLEKNLDWDRDIIFFKFQAASVATPADGSHLGLRQKNKLLRETWVFLPRTTQSKLDQRRQNRIKLFSNDSKARSPGFTGVLEQFPVWVEWLQLRTRISIDETPPGLAWCLWCPAIILINGF